MKFLVFLSLLASTSAFADSFEFECEGSDLVYINSFSMRGMVDTQDDTIHYTVTTRENGHNGVVETREDITRSATLDLVTESETDKVIAYRAYSVDFEDDHEYVNLLIDYPNKLSSQIRNQSGREFRSTCRIL